ncbi:lysine methyltransferase [Pseudomonas sp. B21-051]|uniref:SET domain-containing protein-lysine N-methyltransferase n=1 Tax=Pseudomonas sp. B21-051 TaxID=2895491 RepID=UPI00215EB6F0|nr:SET domain-containing protein-lysine N-methyltransferase [Pseudomonas sp. B21-051]UVK87599.1 lysine methyltransferase [Pseudomonas sp. B21-051]
MNNQAHQHNIPRDAPGIYPFAGLPVRLGFPSTEDFEIVQDHHGHATVVARRAFLRITRMCRVSGQLLPYRCRQTRQLLTGIHLYDPRFCGLLEHACDPNVFLDMSELWLWALRDIQPGERLTIDFAATEDRLLQQFACTCDSPRCRGWITGYDEPPSIKGQHFLQHWRHTH